MRSIKGWFGEKKAALSMWLTLDEDTYRRFHDVIIPTVNGTTQIDHILVSPFGLFIVETRNGTGWIFGSKDQARWTQSLHGKSFSFQNPLRPAYRQKKCLSECLQVDQRVIHTVVYFNGDSELESSMPMNVIDRGLGRYVKTFANRVLRPEEVDQIVGTLERHQFESSTTTRQHVRSLRERLGSSTVCPRCGSRLVERTARRDPDAGSKFLGCESYPRCRFTKNVSPA